MKGRSLLEGNVAALTEPFRESMHSEDIASRNGLLQSLDPRTKAVCGIVFLVAVAVTPLIPVLSGIYLAVLALAYASKIPLRRFILRVWLFLPFFTVLVVLPVIFGSVTPGHRIGGIVSVFGHGLYVTDAGLFVAGRLILRVAVSVSAVTVIMQTTRQAHMLKAFRALGMPPTMVMVFLMAYRYVYILLTFAENMMIARKSRMVGESSPASERRFLASAAGRILLRSFERSQDVYSAMTSRGFTGTIRLDTASAFGFRDAAAIFISVAVFVVVWQTGRHL